MTVFIIFILAVIVLVALFATKHIELKKDAVLFANKHREQCDKYIVKLEEDYAHKCTRENAKHFIIHMYNTIAHKFARLTANIAKRVEWRARNVAHKSAKAKAGVAEARENGYLKDVQNHKDSLDTAKVAEEAKL